MPATLCESAPIAEGDEVMVGKGSSRWRVDYIDPARTFARIGVTGNDHEAMVKSRVVELSELRRPDA